MFELFIYKNNLTSKWFYRLMFYFMTVFFLTIVARLSIDIIMTKSGGLIAECSRCSKKKPSK